MLQANQGTEDRTHRTAIGRMLRAASLAVLSALLSITVMPCTLSFADPADAVPPTDDGSVGIYSATSSADRAPDDNASDIDEGEQLRDEQGRVSQLSTDTHNPYNGQIRLDLDIGSEFADFIGCDYTEGYRLKVTPGGTVTLPKLRARDGYYFVGWGQGGVPYEPTWAPDIEQVEMGTDTSQGKNTTIFALFADEEGNGYCTCGAYEQGIYADKMDEIIAANDEYNASNGTAVRMQLESDPVKARGLVALMIGMCLIALSIAAVYDRNHDDGEYL